MATFTSKYDIGQNMRFSFGGEQITGTVWGITFTSDMPPQYQIEALNDREWTERYFDIHEDKLEAV